jgi:K+-transporting ATPase KdpF subunit
MSLDMLLGGLASVAMGVYLLVALLHPEKF